MSEGINADIDFTQGSKEENNQEVIEPPENDEPELVKRGKGRPVGVKDKVPRTRKNMIIVEEHITPKPKKEETSVAPVEAPPTSPNLVTSPEPHADPPQREILSPRTLYRSAAEVLTSMHRAKYDQRKENLRSMYSKAMTKING